MFEGFTDQARQVVVLAQEEADRLQHRYLGPEHVLLGLLRQDDTLAARVLRAHGLDLATARAEVDRLVGQGVLPGPRPSDAELLGSLGIDLAAVRRSVEETFGAEACAEATWRVMTRRRDNVPWTPMGGRPPAAKRALQLAGEEAAALGHEVAPEHVLLGLLRDARDPVAAAAPRGGSAAAPAAHRRRRAGLHRRGRRQSAAPLARHAAGAGSQGSSLR